MLISTTDRKEDKKARVDARTHAIAQELEALRIKRGMSKAELARRAKVHATQLSQILLGHQGLSLERLSDLLEVLGAAMLITEADEAARAPSIGTVNAGGGLVTGPDQRLVFPSYCETSTECGDFAAGERLFVREHTEYEPDKWMLCQRGQDRYLLKGRVINGVQLLVSVHGDEIVYRPDRYKVLAVVYGRFRAL